MLQLLFLVCSLILICTNIMVRLVISEWQTGNYFVKASFDQYPSQNQMVLLFISPMVGNNRNSLWSESDRYNIDIFLPKKFSLLCPCYDSDITLQMTETFTECRRGATKCTAGPRGLTPPLPRYALQFQVVLSLISLLCSCYVFCRV